MVGSFITPYLAKHHDAAGAGRRCPRSTRTSWSTSGVHLEARTTSRARSTGMDTFVNLVMRSPQGGSVTDQDLTIIKNNYEVNTLGLHILLWTAQGMGIKQGVHTSTMSVHFRERTWYPTEEIGAARFSLRLRPDQGPGRADLRLLRALVRHAHRGPADHRSAHPRGVPGGAPQPHPRGAVCHRRGGPRPRVPRGDRGGPGGPSALRRGLDRGRRARGDAQPDQGARAPGLDAGEPPAASRSRRRAITRRSRPPRSPGSAAGAGQRRLEIDEPALPARGERIEQDEGFGSATAPARPPDTRRPPAVARRGSFVPWIRDATRLRSAGARASSG